jgi:hypothetical protein
MQFVYVLRVYESDCTFEDCPEMKGLFVIPKEVKSNYTSIPMWLNTLQTVLVLPASIVEKYPQKYSVNNKICLLSPDSLLLIAHHHLPRWSCLAHRVLLK